MKRIFSPILILFFACGLAVPVAHLVSNSQSPQTVRAGSGLQPTEKKARTISYKGVSFTFDPLLSSDAKWETVPKLVDDPNYIIPEHPALTLVGYQPPGGLVVGDAQIRIFPTGKFREAVAEAGREYFKQVVYPRDPIDWTIDFDSEIRTLKILIAEKPGPGNLRAVIARARLGKDCSQMPFLPMRQGCQAFVAHLRYVKFRGGEGVFFLTQWDRETTQVSNDSLEYEYQGITEDGLYYVDAEFSVKAPFLPNGDEPEVVAWNEKNYLLPHPAKEYQDYLRPVLAKLEALPANKYQPNLGLIEKLIQSLEIQKQ